MRETPLGPTKLSSWRTLVFGRGMLAFFAICGGAPMWVLLTSPDDFDWFGGGTPPWYAPFLLAAFLVVVLRFVHGVVGGLQPVWVDGPRIVVSGWLGKKEFPLESISSLHVDRTAVMGGRNPVRVTLRHQGRTRRYAFLLAEELDYHDLERLTGHAVEDPHGRTDGEHA